MFTFLDLLIVVVMALVAVGVLALAGTFLIRNKTAKKLCFYVVSALGIYVGYAGCRILWPGFMPQVLLALALAAVSVGALVLTLVKKGDEKVFRIAQVAASVAMVVGMINAFVW